MRNLFPETPVLPWIRRLVLVPESQTINIDAATKTVTCADYCTIGELLEAIRYGQERDREREDWRDGNVSL